MTIRCILFATDLGVRCDRALDRALKLATEHAARLVVLHVLQHPDASFDHHAWRHPTDPLVAARRRVEVDVGNHEHIDIHVLVEQGEPADTILKVAHQNDCDLIVTGMARDEAIGRILLGKTVTTLSTLTDVPVLVVKSRPRTAYRNVVVATDFSEGSRAGFETALTLFPQALITLFHAFDVIYETFMTDKMAARAALQRQAMDECEAFIETTPLAKAAQPKILTICEYGDPGVLLNELVPERHVDLVVLGTEGRSGLAGFLLGSSAQRLATELPADVLLVRRPRS